jgi:hypothetical protein
VHQGLLAVAGRVLVDGQGRLRGRAGGRRERRGGDDQAGDSRFRQGAEASVAPLISPRRYIPGGMPTYVMLSTLSPEGVQTIKSNPARIREVNKELEQLGVTVKAQWAVLGRYDFVNVI